MLRQLTAICRPTLSIYLPLYSSTISNTYYYYRTIQTTTTSTTSTPPPIYPYLSTMSSFSANALEELKRLTTVVADTGEVAAIAAFSPQGKIDRLID